MIFIDGGNFYHVIKHLEDKGYLVDFEKIINRLARGRGVKTHYYTALLDKNYNLEKYLQHKSFGSSPHFELIM